MVLETAKSSNFNQKATDESFCSSIIETTISPPPNYLICSSICLENKFIILNSTYLKTIFSLKKIKQRKKITFVIENLVWFHIIFTKLTNNEINKI